MDTAANFRLAIQEFGLQVPAIGDERWNGTGCAADPDVRVIVNCVVRETRWVPPLLGGRTIAEVGNRFDGDLLGEDPKAAWHGASEEALKAVGAAGALEGSVQLARGETPAATYISELTAFIAVQTWDLSRAVGSANTLPSELVEFAYATVQPRIEEFRAAGLVGEALDFPAGADRQTQLLALVGRRA